MARSVAADPSLHRAARARTAAARRGAGRSRRPPATRSAWPLRAVLGAAALAGHWLRAIWVRRRARLALLAAIVGLALASAGWIWFRDSSFVAVEQVGISGVHGGEVAQIDAALRSAAERMTTLHASAAPLQAAVAGFPIVRGVRIRTSFPHRMTISVREQLPVAVLSAGDARTAVAADGVVLGPEELSSSLPVLTGPVDLPARGETVMGATLRSYLTVLGAAPPTVEHLVEGIYYGPEGLTVKMRDGLLVYFGNDTRPHAKWLSLARVLADPTSAGAAYIDVRLPERPASGTDPHPLKASSVKDEAAGEAALEANLDRAVGGEEATASTGATGEAQSTPGEAEVQSSEAQAEAGEAPAGTDEADGGQAEASPGQAPVQEAQSGEYPPAQAPPPEATPAP